MAVFMQAVCVWPSRVRAQDFALPAPSAVMETVRQAGSDMPGVKGVSAVSALAAMPGLSREMLERNGVEIDPSDTANQVLEKLFNSPNATSLDRKDLEGIWAGRSFSFYPNKGTMDLLSGREVKNISDGGPLFDDQKKVFKIGSYGELEGPGERSRAADYDNGIPGWHYQEVKKRFDESAAGASTPKFSDSGVDFTNEYGMSVRLRKFDKYIIGRFESQSEGKPPSVTYSYYFKRIGRR